MTTDNGETFTCWKEIAAYLGKGVRTVQRWERQFGLPVQRPNEHEKGIVRASRKELDEWTQTNWSCAATKTRKHGSPLPVPSPTMQNIEILRDLRASNKEILRQFKESLRMLNTTCEQLCGALGRRPNVDGRPTAA